MCTATATDRQRGTFLQTVCLGRMPASHLRGGFEASVDWSASLLVTDGHQACAALADGDDRPHTSLKGGKGRGGIHIQTGSSLHSQLKGWIRRFNGVATKQLDHYPAFFQSRDADPVPLLAERAGWDQCPQPARNADGPHLKSCPAWRRRTARSAGTDPVRCACHPRWPVWPPVPGGFRRQFGRNPANRSRRTAAEGAAEQSDHCDSSNEPSIMVYCPEATMLIGMDA